MVRGAWGKVPPAAFAESCIVTRERYCVGLACKDLSPSFRDTKNRCPKDNGFFWHARRDSAEGRAELRQPATGRLLGTSRKSWCLLLHRSFIAIIRVQLLAHKNRGPTGLGFGTPEGTRTPNPRTRNPMLYPLSHWRICMGYYNRLRRQSKAIF